MNEQMMIDSGAGQQLPVRRRPQSTLDSVVSEPMRGGEPKPLGQVMEPFKRIMAHPDRNRLMAEFFKRYW